MIIATAGHVDHGKTLLVKALTGVDADRLPEEKKRGMTIDLGFAYLPVDGADRIGFVDVPGHERFIHNMLCGVTAIDFALLIVAAGDGPMPQTVEHLAVLDLLGVGLGAVALTKIDLTKIDGVPGQRQNEAVSEVEALLAGTTLAGSPIFPVSAVTGEGIEDLKRHLLAAARRLPARSPAGNFRMAVDRCFTIAGAGLVVTGTVQSGSICAGDFVHVPGAGQPVRVRGIHAQNEANPIGKAGQRCALNLVCKGPFRRGDWIVTGDVPPPVRRFDARLRVLQIEANRFRHWTPVHVHLGASDVTGHVAILEGTLVQLVLDQPLGALWGDRFIVRDQSAQRTLGGGRVIDIFPPPRGRARPVRLAYLGAMEDPDPASALRRLLDVSPQGLDLVRFAANRNLTPAETAELSSQAVVRAGLAFSPSGWATLKAKTLAALADWHRRFPNTFGPSEERLLAAAGLRQSVGIVTELVEKRAVVKGPYGVRLPGHRPNLNPADAALWKKVAPRIEGTLRPPTVHELAASTGETPQRIESLLSRAARLSLVVHVAPNRFYMPASIFMLGRIAEQLASESPDRLVAAAAFRDRAGVGRNVSIEILEFFDRVKFTRRVGAGHVVVQSAEQVFGREPHPGGAPGLQIR